MFFHAHSNPIYCRNKIRVRGDDDCCVVFIINRSDNEISGHFYIDTFLAEAINMKHIYMSFMKFRVLLRTRVNFYFFSAKT